MVAERVETQNQLDILQRFSRPIVQGFELAHPKPLGKIIEWLRSTTPGGTVQFGGADMKPELTPKPQAS